MSEENKEVIPERDYESEARKQGWVPQEEYKGNKEAWLEAKDFVIRGEQINPILRSTNERIKSELEKTKAEMQELRKAAEEFKTYQKEQYERKVAAWESEIAALKKEKAQAVSAGDGERVTEIDDQIESIKEQKTQAKEDVKKEEKKQETPQAEAPEVTAWKNANPWYEMDLTMTSATNAVAQTLASTHPDLRGKAFLEELDKRLEELFSPEKLGKKTRPRSPVESGNGGHKPSSNSKQSYENLPPDAKAACDRFVKQKLMTREDYVANYDWE